MTVKTTMTNLKKLLPVYIKANKPVMIWGGPGEGKSGLIRSVVESVNADLQDFRLLMRDAVDVHGLPMTENGRMAWAYPKEMPLATDNIERLRVMFLDELPAAATAVQTVAYQMLHERAIDDQPLHENVRFIAAGNRERDGAVSNRMPTPLANRMAHFDVTADLPSWLSWGHNAGVHPFILAHLENSPQDLRVADEKEYLTQKAFRSPRSWEYASDVVTEVLRGVEDVTDTHMDIITDVVGSFVGEATAANFMGYIKVGSKLPKPNDILSGKVSAKKFELHEQFFITCGLLATLSEARKSIEVGGNKNYQQDSKFTSSVDNMLSFAKESFDAEALAAFANRFIGKDWYGFQFNNESKIQKEFARWLFSAQDGAAKLVFAS